jgi:hypothetical protein
MGSPRRPFPRARFPNPLQGLFRVQENASASEEIRRVGTVGHDHYGGAFRLLVAGVFDLFYGAEIGA